MPCSVRGLPALTTARRVPSRSPLVPWRGRRVAMLPWTSLQPYLISHAGVIILWSFSTIGPPRFFYSMQTCSQTILKSDSSFSVHIQTVRRLHLALHPHEVAIRVALPSRAKSFACGHWSILLQTGNHPNSDDVLYGCNAGAVGPGCSRGLSHSGYTMMARCDVSHVGYRYIRRVGEALVRRNWRPAPINVA